MLSTVDDYEIGQIADSLKFSVHRPGEYVIKEGEIGNVFYMIEEGEAEVTNTLEPGKCPVSVKFYTVGDYFGELALIKGEPRAANIIARVNEYIKYFFIFSRISNLSRLIEMVSRG